ncbi:VirB2 family type IV secretion system major pilin TrwL [Bartonella sp. A05]|uniref:VirB2 family type IV secretion system major pilin TrwL n=1 Tax=Bartonella sp. A05 TaxID=2967261 RepID=UPI0022A8D4ED|nr:VirB2 family type IV secretion system major pilin TrwL [Bartonella sp. A05]MCZ2203609.1 VirB2 family type IV secretion system major pilin TrwL [Bartonella sp. A05]
MKLSNIFQEKINNRIIFAFATAIVFFMAHPTYAQNLTGAKTVLETLTTQLNGIIPIAAALILLGLAIGYAGRYIEKDTFIRWAIGVVVAGSASQLAILLFKQA